MMQDAIKTKKRNKTKNILYLNTTKS